MSGAPTPPGSPFAAPWQARAFAIAVHLAESGALPWDAIKARLIAEVAVGEDGYYEQFLRALEGALAASGLVGAAALADRTADLAAHPPHPPASVRNPVAVDRGRASSRRRP